jgi:hypothetical protein
LIAKLEAELKAMDQIHHSPALDTLRDEKRQLIDNLQTADKLEAEFKGRQLEHLHAANKLEADLKALDAMDDSPTLEALRDEKRTQLHNLQTADKSDREQTTKELQRLQDPATAAAPVAPAAIFDPEPAAAGRKPWWQEAKERAQRRWREVKAKAVKEEQQPETPAAAAEDAKPEHPSEVQNTTGAEAQATPVEAPAAAAEEAKPEEVQAAPAEEAKPAECLDAVPGDRCHEFVTWSLGKGLAQHADWFPSFKLSESDEQNFKQMQEILHSKGKAGCGKPCPA